MLLLLLSCQAPDAPKDSEGSETTTVFIGRCGDGVVDDDEACDDGTANSDLLADACRGDCREARCGDAVVDTEEACDDGETWGGDGCDPSCADEPGTGELEPNDSWDAAQVGSDVVSGALSVADTDCFVVEVEACGAVAVVEAAPCSRSLTLTLHGPDGGVVAAGGTDAEGCAVLDPVEEPGARWVAGGPYAVCVAGTNGAEQRGYTLAFSTPDPSTLDAPSIGADLDGDVIPDSCDADLDGDGLDNDADNCPEVSNGPDSPPYALDASGFVIGWLGIGPYTTGATTLDCRPSEDAFVGEDGDLSPSFGDPVGDLVWTLELPGTADFNLLTPYGSVAAPREAYTLVYLRSDSARSLTLAVGADDGVFAWWNSERVLDVSACQGITYDQFQAPVEVLEGWNTLLLKVRDAGGGWDVAARLLDGEGAAVVDLEPSMVPGESWIADQSDADGDGVGNLCDDG